MTPAVITSIGLVLDIVGAIFMVKGIVAGTDDELARASDARGVWGSGTDTPSPRPALLRMLKESRRDTRIGAGLLIVGFMAQLVAQWIR